MPSPIAGWTLLSRASSTPRSSQSLAVSGQGLIALYGGELKPRTPVDSGDDKAGEAPRGSVHVFDLKVHQVASAAQAVQNSFTTLRPSDAAHATIAVPEPRVGATTVFEGGSLYLWGGRGGIDMSPLGPPQTGLWRAVLDQASGVTWEPVPAINEDQAPEPRSYHTAVSHDGRIYIHAGCPTVGRVGTLHAFDLRTREWCELSAAPGPGRGGTALAVTTLQDGTAVFVRFGGFAGHELPTPEHEGCIDVYTVDKDAWETVTPAPDPTHGFPGARSVHGLVGLRPGADAPADGVALMYHGERDASTLGHAGAGTFWDDVWVLEHTPAAGWRWRKALVEVAGGGAGPEARGWFPSAGWVDEAGKGRAVMHGGLVSSNERRADLWMLELV